MDHRVVVCNLYCTELQCAEELTGTEAKPSRYAYIINIK